MSLIVVIRKWDTMANKWNELVQERTEVIDEGKADKILKFVGFANMAGRYLREAKIKGGENAEDT